MRVCVLCWGKLWGGQATALSKHKQAGGIMEGKQRVKGCSNPVTGETCQHLGDEENVNDRNAFVLEAGGHFQNKEVGGRFFLLS